MSRKKKIAALILAVAMVFCCVGCGAAPTTAAESQEKSLALLLAQEDEFLRELKENVEAEAQARGYEVRYYSAEGNSETQLRQVHEALAAGAKTLIVNMTNDELSEQIEAVVGDANVVLVNRAPENRAMLNEKMVFVGVDETQCGDLQGEALAEYFWESGLGPEIRYLLFQGVPGLENTDARSNGVLQSLTDRGFVPIAAAEYQVCNFYRDQARNAMEALLERGVEFDCIICNNDAMALGVIEAMEAIGMAPENVPIVGIDHTADGNAAVQAGKLYMTVDQNVQMQAATAVEVAVQLAEGYTFDRGIVQPADASFSSPYMIRIPADIAAEG